MKKNMMKKLGALSLAAALTAAMSTAVFAETTIGENTVGAAGSSVTFTDLFLTETAVNLPSAEFTYGIAPGSGQAATATTPKILSGADGAVISGGAHAATAAGTTEDRVDVTADFSGCSFTEAGIYRYAVTEAEGISNVPDDIEIDADNENSGSYVLDVYVKKDAGAFAPYAYILSKTGQATAAVDGGQTIVTYADKVDTITNVYTTYTLTISESIVGDMAANEFAFTAALGGLHEDTLITVDGEVQEAAESYTVNKNLANDGTIVISSLPSTAVYAVQEAVNELEGYQIEVEDSLAADGEYSWIGEEGSAESFGKVEVTVIGAADHEVGFTNTLRSISPTGVILRFAPYILMLAGGLALLLVLKRRSREEA